MPKYLVLIVLDGAEPEYFHMGVTPHLEALRLAGIEYDQSFAGILESETPAGHATLSTGSTPAHDGMLGFNWVNGDNSTIHTFDPNVVRAGTVERIMQQAGAPTIASAFKQKYPKAKVVALSGHKYYAADPLGGPNADYIMYYAPDAHNHYVPTAIPGHVPPASVLNAPGLSTATTTLPPGGEDHLAMKLAVHTFQTIHQQITLINVPEFDWPLGHVYGGDPVKASYLMQSFDKDLGMLERAYAKAGVLDKTLFVITADHGMAPLKYQIPDQVLDGAVTKAGATSAETTYSTGGYIWLQNPAAAQTVANNVVAQHNAHIESVYYKVTTKRGDRFVRAGGLDIPPLVESANQYLLSSFAGGNSPDVVAMCMEDSAFVAQGAASWKGNHGGATWNSQHMPLLISGPGVVRGVTSASPARLEDIAPTVLTLMGASPRRMDGSVLADALAHPTGEQTQTQATLNLQLNPVVQALSAQSQGELSAEAASE
jgi:hypothetical protein